MQPRNNDHLNYLTVMQFVFFIRTVHAQITSLRNSPVQLFTKITKGWLIDRRSCFYLLYTGKSIPQRCSEVKIAVPERWGGRFLPTLSDTFLIPVLDWSLSAKHIKFVETARWSFWCSVTGRPDAPMFRPGSPSRLPMLQWGALRILPALLAGPLTTADDCARYVIRSI